MMIRKLLAALAAVPLVLGGASAAARGPAPLNCAGLTAAHIPQGTVTSAAAADGYCQVQGVLKPATKFTVKLPVSGWTGEYVQQDAAACAARSPT